MYILIYKHTTYRLPVTLIGQMEFKFGISILEQPLAEISENFVLQKLPSLKKKVISRRPLRQSFSVSSIV